MQLFYKTENYSCVNSVYFNINIKLIKSIIAFKILEINIMLITFYVV